MNWFQATATLGSMAIGLGLIAYSLIVWWPGLKGLRGAPWDAVRSLLPFLLAYCYGALLILGVGGVIGWIADATLWGIGYVGDFVLIYGVGGQRQGVSVAGQTMALTNGGLMTVLVLTFVVIALRKKCAAETTKAIGRGVLAGILTGTVASVGAVLAIPLASAVNAAGAWMNGVG